MEIKVLSAMGDFATNAYIVSSGDTAVLIDAPCDADVIISALGDLKLSAILLTHGHIDHISAAAEVKAKTDCKVYISKEDEPCLTSSVLSKADYFGVPFYPCEESATFSDGDELTFGDMTFKIMMTPGHTAGCASFVIEDVIFSGDTLFAGSIGRRFETEGYDNIFVSIAGYYALGGDYRVLSGHGLATTLYQEFNSNPFLGYLRDYTGDK